MNSSKNQFKRSVRESDTIRKELAALHDRDMLSWREIAEIPEYQPIPAGTLCSIYNGDPIPKKWMAQLGVIEPVETEPCRSCGEVHKKKGCKYDREPWSERPIRKQPAELLRWRLEHREEF